MIRLTGAELQAARRAAAEKFLAIGTFYVPAGWTVKYRKSLSGRCIYRHKIIDAPKPVTRKALYIFLHECAHAILHYPIVARSLSEYRRKPKHVVELEAEQWAHATMRQHGIAVPRAMTVRAKDYVARKILQAELRGAKSIDPAARRYARRS
jgi:hypothetical protein